MEMNVTFSETMVLKIVMDVANCGVGSFSNLTHLVNEIVHLPGESLTHYSEDSTFMWGFKVYRSWMHWITWDMNLLGIVK